MKTLIVYASSKGYTRECATYVKERLEGETEMVDLKRVKQPDLSGYDQVIIGAGVHASNLPQSVKRFVQQQQSQLVDKRLLGIFICSLDEERWEESLTQLPEDVAAHAQVKQWFGGRIIFSQHMFLLRKFLKAITKAQEDLHREQPGRMEEFVKEYNQLMGSPS